MPVIALPGLVFLTNALLYVTLMTLLPAIADSLALDKAQLGLALLGIPVGTLVALPITARITDRLGAGRAAAAMLALIALSLPFSLTLPYAGLVALLAVFGFARAVLEVAQNLLAREIEVSTGRNVLARSHGFWSLGLLFGALYGAGMAHLALGPAAQQIGASLIAAGLILCVLRLGAGRRAEAAPLPAPRGLGLTIPDAAILWVCAIFFGISLVEGVTYDWGMFYLTDTLRMGDATANITFAAFTIGMGGVRLSGDWLRQHLSTRRLLLCSFACAFAGVAVLLAAPQGLMPVACLGMALIGAGIALVAPLSVVMVSAMKNRPLAENLACLSLANMVSVVAVPAIMGHAAEAWGVAAAFWLLLPAILSSALLLTRRTGDAPAAGQPLAGG